MCGQKNNVHTPPLLYSLFVFAVCVCGGGGGGSSCVHPTHSFHWHCTSKLLCTVKARSILVRTQRIWSLVSPSHQFSSKKFIYFFIFSSGWKGCPCPAKRGTLTDTQNNLETCWRLMHLAVFCRAWCWRILRSFQCTLEWTAQLLQTIYRKLEIKYMSGFIRLRCCDRPLLLVLLMSFCAFQETLSKTLWMAIFWHQMNRHLCRGLPNKFVPKVYFLCVMLVGAGLPHKSSDCSWNKIKMFLVQLLLFRYK